MIGRERRHGSFWPVLARTADEGQGLTAGRWLSRTEAGGGDDGSNERRAQQRAAGPGCTKGRVEKGARLSIAGIGARDVLGSQKYRDWG